MQRIVETDNKKPPAPHSWAIASNGILYSVHVPIRPDGLIEDGSISKQTRVTMNDLLTTLMAAGAGAKNVSLVQIYLTSLDHKPAVDKIYNDYFKDPKPVRACVAVSGLPTPGTAIEMVVTSTLPSYNRE